MCSPLTATPIILALSIAGACLNTATAAESTNPVPCYIELIKTEPLPWPKHKKLLIFASQDFKSKGHNGVYTWTYPEAGGSGVFTPNGATVPPATNQNSTMVAQDKPTAKDHLDKDKLVLTLQDANGTACADRNPLNLTFPRYFAFIGSTDKTQTPPTIQTKPAITATATFNRGSADLAMACDLLIRYDIHDQFDAPMPDSEYKSANPMTREDLVLHFATPGGKPPQTQPNWKKNGGLQQTDEIQIFLALQGLKDSKGNFDVTKWKKGDAVVTLASTHDWHTSVDQKHDTKVTANTLVVAIDTITAGSLKLLTTYTVVTQ